MNATAAVDHVFSIMGATYGAAWDRSLGTAPIVDVKTIWADALSGFMHSDESKRMIMWGLKNLPDTVINARQFRSLCKTAPSKKLDMLPAPTVNPEIAAKVLGALSREIKTIDHKQWAMVILANPKGRTPTVIQMAKDALKTD